MIEQAGVQLFTIRKYTQTPEALEATLRKLHAMGFSRFELARIRFSPEELAVLKRLKEELGVVYTASQIKLKTIQKRLDWLMEFSQALGIEYLEVSVIPLKAFLGKEKGLRALAAELNALGEQTKARGVSLLYHHHNFELVRLGDRMGIDILLQETDSRFVNFVADTYWLARSGIHPGGFIARHKDRIQGIHLRDCQYRFSRLRFSFNDCAVGEGSVDFGFLAEMGGRFLSVEQATDQPFEQLGKSRAFLERIL